MMVPCLYDGGSESTYFHPEMEPMGILRRKKTFHLETLSMQGQVEEVDGLIVTFEAIMADGQVRKIEALKHHGLGRAGHKLRAKVLSVPTAFANHWGLEQQGLTQVDPTNPHNSMYTRQPHRLMLVVGVDLIHLFPQLLDSYHDEHGVVQLHHCFFSGRTVACGNRTYPLAPKTIKKKTFCLALKAQQAFLELLMS